MENSFILSFGSNEDRNKQIWLCPAWLEFGSVPGSGVHNFCLRNQAPATINCSTEWTDRLWDEWNMGLSPGFFSLQPIFDIIARMTFIKCIPDHAVPTETPALDLSFITFKLKYRLNIYEPDIHNVKCSKLWDVFNTNNDATSRKFHTWPPLNGSQWKRNMIKRL